MSIFLLIAISMIIMIIMLRRRLPVGLAVLAAGAVLWLGTGAEPSQSATPKTCEKKRSLV